MFRSLWCRVGANLKRTARTTINGESFSSSPSSFSTPTRYLLFTLQNPDVLNRTRVSSKFCSLSSISNNATSDSFVLNYLINSCGLSENEAITVSKKIRFKPASQPDSVLTLFENYGFSKPYISKLIIKRPSLLLSDDPLETLKPKLDFFNSKGIHGIELADFISRYPFVLTLKLQTKIIPVFDFLKSIVHTDTNVIRIIKQSHSYIFRINLVKTLMVNLELLKCEGIPESTISKYLIKKPVIFMVDADKFKKIVEKVKEMGFNPLASTFIIAIKGLTSEANWRKKMDVYRRWGWSEDQMQSAFRKSPCCVTQSEKKITAVMDFLVNEMGYDSASIVETPAILNNSLKERIIPKCSVVRILVSKGLIKENVPLTSLSRMTDKSFLDRFVKPFEQEAPELLKVFQGLE